MQNSLCKNATSPCCCKHKDSAKKEASAPKANGLNEFKPELLIFNIEKAKQVCLHNVPKNYNQRVNIERPKTTGMKAKPLQQKEKINECYISCEEYQKLIKNQKNQKPKPMPQKQQNSRMNECLIPIQEYQMLVENQNGQKQQFQEKNHRPKTAMPDIKYCTLTCDEYMKLTNGKQDKVEERPKTCCHQKKNQLKDLKQEPAKPKTAEERYAEQYFKELENDRWITTYQSAFTWKKI